MEQNKILIDVEDVEKTLEQIDFKGMRVKNSLTLRQVEGLTGISNPYLSQIEQKKVPNPSFRVVMLLLKTYGITSA